MRLWLKSALPRLADEGKAQKTQPGTSGEKATPAQPQPPKNEPDGKSLISIGAQLDFGYGMKSVPKGLQNGSPNYCIVALPAGMQYGLGGVCVLRPFDKEGAFNNFEIPITLGYRYGKRTATNNYDTYQLFANNNLFT